MEAKELSYKDKNMDTFLLHVKEEFLKKGKFPVTMTGLLEYAEKSKNPLCFIISFGQYGSAKKTKTRPAYNIYNVSYEYNGKYESFSGTKEGMIAKIQKLNAEIAIKNDLVFILDNHSSLMSRTQMHYSNTEKGILNKEKFILDYCKTIPEWNENLALEFVDYQATDYLSMLVKQLHS